MRIRLQAACCDCDTIHRNQSIAPIENHSSASSFRRAEVSRISIACAEHPVDCQDCRVRQFLPGFVELIRAARHPCELKTSYYLEAKAVNVKIKGWEHKQAELQKPSTEPSVRWNAAQYQCDHADEITTAPGGSSRFRFATGAFFAPSS